MSDEELVAMRKRVEEIEDVAMDGNGPGYFVEIARARGLATGTLELKPHAKAIQPGTGAGRLSRAE